MKTHHYRLLLRLSMIVCGALLTLGLTFIYTSSRTSHGSSFWVLVVLLVGVLSLAGLLYWSMHTNISLQRQLSKHHENFEATLKEISDYKYALDESAIVAITDQKGIIRHVNNNFIRISKYSREELIGQDHRIINSGYHPKEFIRELWKTIAQGTIWRGELRNKAKDGTIYWVDTTIVPFLNEAGKPYQYVAIRADITERKNTEENLRKTLREISDYKYALDESSIVAITDQKGIIQYVNDNFCKISKYSRRELIHQDHRIINSGHHPKDFIRQIWVTIAHGKIWKGELKNKAKDGSFYWVDTTIVPFLNEAGKPYQYVAIRSDITQQKNAEEKLIQSERIYKTIASGIPGSVICLLNTDYRYFLIEGDMLEKLGYSREMLLGKRPHDVLPTEMLDPLLEDLRKVLNDETFSTESHRNGFDLINRFVPLKDEGKNVYAIMIIVIDVTNLKKAQRHIIDLNSGLERKINERTRQLASANQELEAFSYSVAHDLRTPLRAVAGYATMLSEDYSGLIDTEGQRFLKELQYNTQKMGHLIDDLLTFSRLGRKPITKSRVDMELLIASVLEEVNTDRAAVIKHDLLPVTADAALIRHVMSNLLSNAIKYSSKNNDSRIEITSERTGRTVTYSVRDNGVGFDMAYVGKLFGVFQRLHPDEEFDGTGVGLAIVQRIINRHGGRVWADAKIDEGATFFFTLSDDEYEHTSS